MGRELSCEIGDLVDRQVLVNVEKDRIETDSVTGKQPLLRSHSLDGVDNRHILT